MLIYEKKFIIQMTHILDYEIIFFTCFLDLTTMEEAGVIPATQLRPFGSWSIQTFFSEASASLVVAENMLAKSNFLT